MDTLNFVVNLLNLLVNLFTGLVPFVWMVAKDVFQTTKHDAKHFSDKKVNDRLEPTKPSGRFTF